MNLSTFKTVLDIAVKMIEISALKDGNINFRVADTLVGLDYEESSFDLIMASYVLHGL